MIMIADINGGAINLPFASQITLNGNSNVIFVNNEASNGGAVYCDQNCIMEYNGHTQAIYIANKAMLAGGALFILSKRILTKENSTIKLVLTKL